MDLPAALDVGDTFGSYRVRRVIDTGANPVYEAEVTSQGARTGEVVALKVFASGDPDVRQRAEAASREWRHPHVIRLNAVGDVDGTGFVDMQLVDAPTVRDWLDDERPLTVAIAVAVVTQIGDAMDAAHAVGLLHGAVAPRRVFVTADDQVYVTPFGLAGPTVTAPVGPADPYVAPERYGSGAVTPTADVYALARLLSDLVTGEGRRELPPDLTAVVARGLASDPARRYQSAGELTAAVAEASVTASNSSTTTPVEHERALPFHDDVQFTVYRPRTVRVLQWTPLLAFAHLGEAPLGTDPEDDPIAQVQRRAEAVLGPRIASFAQMTQDSSVGLPEESDVTFVLELPGFDVRAPSRTFAWVNAVHMEEFQIRAQVPMGTARGQLRILHGSILLAEVRLAIRVDNDGPAVAPPPDVPVTVRPFRKIFPSYSHLDEPIVIQFERYMESLGDRYLRDVYTLRSGEHWHARLCELIDEADVFQLFWSHNSMQSRFVADEWRYALSLNRNGFIRPTYWETPMPTAPGMPPADLGQLHFHPLGRSDGTHALPPPEPMPAPPPPSPQYANSPPPMAAPPQYPISQPPMAAPPPPMAAAKSTARRRLLPAGLTAAAVAVVAGAIGTQAFLGSNSAPTIAMTESSATRATSAAPTQVTQTQVTQTPATTQEAPTNLSPAARQLVSLLPRDYAACRETPVAGDALATVTCDAPPSPGGPAVVLSSLYADATAMDRQFHALIATDSELLACPGGEGPSPIEWHYDSTPDETAGLLACGRRDGRADVSWTTRSTLILASAQADDLVALHRWWRAEG